MKSIFIFCLEFWGFPIGIFLGSILIVKLHFCNKKACLINLNHETYTI